MHFLWDTKKTIRAVKKNYLYERELPKHIALYAFTIFSFGTTFEYRNLRRLHVNAGSLLVFYTKKGVRQFLFIAKITAPFWAC